MYTTKTILFLGSSGFPFGMAAIQRQLQIAKAMRTDTTRIVVINRKGVHTKDAIQREKIQTRGMYEGIEYIYSSGAPLYFNNFFIRNLLKIVGVIGELFLVLYSRVFKNLQGFVINTLSLNHLKYYYFLSRLIRVKLVYDYVEFMSSLHDRAMLSASNKPTFDTLFFNYTDSIIIISNFLENHIKSIAPTKPYVVVPPIMDFEKFGAVSYNPTEKDYFLYCGSTHYMDVIEFVVESYKKVQHTQPEVSLILIVNGDSEKMTQLHNSISETKGIKILSNLSYETLIGYYKNARALLIPMQDNLQDKARFPFKISEYTAASRPIVSSNSGAVVDYFEDGKNALLAKTGDANDFSFKLSFVVNNQEQAEQMAKNGYELGVHHFNYKTYSTSLLKLVIK